jgi:hypothetical protein
MFRAKQALFLHTLKCNPMVLPEDEFGDISFLDQDKLKNQESKIESGEIVCNKDNPEECENCSG